MLYMPQEREPVLNVPSIVLGLIIAFVGIHALRVWGGDAIDDMMLSQFAFVPARYDGTLPPQLAYLREAGPMLWTPLTYAFLHGDWNHLAFNAIWLVVFGTPVARRIGRLRFLVFILVMAVAGAAAHYLVSRHDIVPMIGASAIDSGLIAAALRFIFQIGGPLGALSYQRTSAYQVPALRLGELLRDRRVMGFVLVWFGLNAATGLLSSYIADGLSVAWQAHIGGFLVGLLLFDLFDKR